MMPASGTAKCGTPSSGAHLAPDDAATYAEWFACLAEPTRVRLLHAVATSVAGMAVGELGELLGISQSTCSHHVRRLADVGFLHLRKQSTTTLVSINRDCCAGLPHAADVVMGVLPCAAAAQLTLPPDVTVRALQDKDWPMVRQIFAEGIATGNATFETETPSRRTLEAKWLPDHRWVAEIDGQVAGWTAITPVSVRECYAGVGETSVYVGDHARGRGVGKALMNRQVAAADEAGLWTLQTSIFPENRASIGLHHIVGYRTLALRERIAQHHGIWRDTVLLERRSPTAGRP